MASSNRPSGDSNLPSWLSTFVGRGSERKHLQEMLDGDRLVSVIGAGGSGKTRLAVEVARDRAERYERGPRFVDLTPISDIGRVAEAIRSGAGAHEQVGRAPVETLTEWIGDDALLLLVDNCEHVLAGVAPTVERLVMACPNLVVLATSREPLGIDGELTLLLPPLDLPPHSADVSSIASYDAVRLFRDRARAVRNDFEIGPDEGVTVGDLVRRLDGMPLAIELAAARVPMMTTSQILRGIDDRFRLLTRTDERDDLRQRTLLASVDWSYHLLDRQEQDLFRRLSVFAGTFSLDAAEQVATGGAVDPSDVLDLVARLVAKSMVVVDRSGVREARYRLLESMRAYATMRLVEAGEDHDLHVRHLEWAGALVATADPQLAGREQQVWLDRLEAEYDNVREALAFAESSSQWDSAWIMAAGLYLFWKLTNRFGEASQILHALLEAGGPQGPTRRAAEWALADLCFWMGEDRECLRRAQAVLDEAREERDPWFEGRATWTLANAWSHFDMRHALELDLASLDMARATGDLWIEGVALSLAGLQLRYMGEHEQARPYLLAALELAGDHDFPQLVAWAWVALQPAAIEAGDFAEADRCYERGMEAARSIRDPATAMHLEEARADGLHLRGRWSEALDVMMGVVADLQISGVKSFVHHIHHRLAVILAGQDDVASEAQVELIGVSHERTPAHRFVMRMARSWPVASSAPPSEAILSMERAATIVRAHGQPRDVTEQLCLLGLVLLDEDLARAADTFHESLTAALDAGLLPWVADALDGVAACEARRGSDAEAARLHAATDRARQEMGTVRHAVIDHRLAPIEAEVRSRLGTAWPTARDEGAGMSLAEAAAHARGNRGRRNRPTTGWASLTPAEEQVVALASEGLTNAQIATRLFVSAGTVKTHLAHAYTKLQVANRTELATAVARRGVPR